MNSRIALLGLIGLTTVAVSGPAFAAGYPPVPQIRANVPVAVVGESASLLVSGQAPAACVGQAVHVALFIRDRAQPSLVSAYSQGGQLPVAAVVGSDGAFSAVVPLPAALASGPTRVWPGFSGSCTAAPIVDESLGVELAVRDTAQNPGSTSTVLLSSAALSSVGNRPDKVTLGAFTGSVTALADGLRCASIATDLAVARGAPLKLRLGGPGQPPQCSSVGARLTFVNAQGQTLYVTMSLIPGVTRLLDNFAEEPPSAGPAATGATPAVPSLGTSVARSSSSAGSAWSVLSEAGVSLVIGAVSLLVFSRLVSRSR